jgi:hypothetical protein
MLEASNISRRTMIAGMGSTFLLVSCGEDMTSSVSVTNTAATGKAVGQLAIGGAKEWIYAAGTTFTAAGHQLKLAGIDQLPIVGERPAELRADTFFAVFDILSGGPMAEGKVQITPSNGPAFDIFLSPSASSEQRVTALFN